MKIDTEQIIPVTKLQKELTKKIQEVADNGNPLFVFKNNELEAVILSAEEFEELSNIREMVEYVEIAAIMETRLSGYDRKKNIPWETLKAEFVAED